MPSRPLLVAALLFSSLRYASAAPPLRTRASLLLRKIRSSPPPARFIRPSFQELSLTPLVRSSPALPFRSGTPTVPCTSPHRRTRTVPTPFRSSRPAHIWLVVSHLGFDTKEIPVTIDAAEPPAPLGITLAVSAINTSITVQGRADDLVGIADSATQGTVGANELQARPLLRSGEVLETVPGLLLTQHAGGGKANQYFLRGFNLDHGTDFAVFLDDVPLNLPSHAHGEGYADINTVIPEFVERVNFEKGPYYADVGNYGSAGSAHLQFFQSLPENFFQIEG